MRLGALGVVLLALAGGAQSAPADDAPQQKVIRPGKLQLDGRSMRCGGVPTIMSHTFWDYGGSSRGTIILNPTKLETLPPIVRLYVYEHECGHQVRGPDELKADCYAVQRGRRSGWLTAEGVQEICDFFGAHPSDSVHPPGPDRCRVMMQCFERAKPPRASR